MNLSHHCVRMRAALILWTPMLFGSVACATGEPLHDPRIAHHAGAALPITLTARNGTVTVPGIGRIDELYLYNAGVDAPGLAPATLHVEPGQAIRLTLKNRLTCGLSAGEGRSPPDQTNIHTHGLLVSPHDKDSHGNYGDFVYYLLQSQANGCGPAAASRMHAGPEAGDAMPMLPSEQGEAHYDIAVPNDHPSGLYWYHPHVHSISGAQVGGGMSGLITIGSLWDYAHVRCALKVSDASHCATEAARRKELAAEAATDEHFLMLKDVQLDKSAQPARWKYNPEFDPGLCDGSSTTPPNPGYCDSADGEKRWLFTVNGQHMPKIAVRAGRAAVLRIANVSANITHILRLRVNAGDANALFVPFQVLAVDGVAKSTLTHAPASTSSVRMMPASRAELYLSSATVCRALAQAGHADLCRAPLHATLEQKGLQTGPDADTWPQMDLATVDIDPTGAQAEPMLHVAPRPSTAKLTGAVTARAASATPSTAPAVGTAQALCGDGSAATTIDSSHGDYRLIALKNGACINGASADCNPGDPNAPESFGMVTELRHSWGGAPADTLPTHPYREFSHDRVDLCIGAPIASGDYFEDWVVSNQAGELHNFHVHQAKFEVLEASATASSDVINVKPTPDALHDTYPINPGGWIRLRMRFTHREQVGKYVYHCHILEHEDKGMMSVIQVVDTSAL